MKNLNPLSEIEQIVLKYCLERKGIIVGNDTRFFFKISVSSRTFNGTSFMTEFTTTQKLKVDVNEETYIIDDLDVILNSSLPSGYIVYVEHGYITALEGFAYGEDWPTNITSVEFEKFQNIG